MSPVRLGDAQPCVRGPPVVARSVLCCSVTGAQYQCCVARCLEGAWWSQAGDGACLLSNLVVTWGLASWVAGMTLGSCLASSATFVFVPGFVYASGLPPLVGFTVPLIAGITVGLVMPGPRF